MKKLLLILTLLAPAVASAGSVAPLGTHTRAWLELQKSGDAAGGPVRPLPGEVADKVWNRYLNSFGQPIPAGFQRERFVGGGGSGGGSSGGR